MGTQEENTALKTHWRKVVDWVSSYTVGFEEDEAPPIEIFIERMDSWGNEYHELNAVYHKYYNRVIVHYI